ncbi:DUF748 domain-containing protein [Andreprevotia chitinilytica]|uniref:DUF748 domain-containing protein n=1 Tax=Andreprevotia chitinilytica TaxID=396808 RepID=UPI000551993E|nr:DUF748 domain-containing protein [Andreprevotia chitinilytica]
MFKRLLLWALGLAMLLAIAAIIGLHFAGGALQAKVVEALGPDSEIGEIKLGWSAIEVTNLRIKGPKGWPTDDALRAERIIIEPDVRALLSANIHIHKITVQGAYLSIWRTANGKVRLLPSLLERAKTAASGDNASSPSTALQVVIDRIALEHGAVDSYDSSIRRPAHKLQLTDANIKLDDLHLPALNNKSELDATATIKGTRRDGSAKIGGWMIFADQDSDLTTTLRGVDLISLQPYLIKASETGVKHGTMDLDLKSAIAKRHLHAPGTITLTDLELTAGGGAWSTFMGMPRDVVINGMKDQSGKIALKFTLDGNLDDPHFSLNENMTKRIGAGLAEGLGVSVKGLAEGVGKTIGKLFGQ